MRAHTASSLARVHQHNISKSRLVEKSHIVPTQYKDVELTELGALQAFVLGHGTGDHWNHLAECRNVLMYGAGHMREQARRRQEDIAPFVEILALCDRAKAALLSIRDREQKTGRFGLSGPEKEVISGLVATSADFWRQQPVWFFGECVKRSRARAHTLIQPKAKS